MSLEGDLMLPPKGPARWGWTQRMMTRIAIARGVISADSSIQASPVTGGLKIAKRDAVRFYGANEYNDLPYGYKGPDINGVIVDIPPDPFQFLPTGSVTGGYIKFNGGSATEVPTRFIGAPANALIVVKVPIRLTAAGQALTPLHWERLTWITDVELRSSPVIDAVPASTVSAGGYVLPGGATEADVLIPIAVVSAAGKRTQWWHGANDIDLGLFHDHFTISR